MVRLPVAPGRSVSILIEVAARSQLLKMRGYDSAKAFIDNMEYVMTRSQEIHEERRRRMGVAKLARSKAKKK
jgi:serine kinase of HPr protein (carbohydrate metabolism regulator)